MLIGLAIGTLCERPLPRELQVVQRLRLIAASAKVIGELRRNLGRDDMKLLFNINAEFAHSLDQRPIELRAKSAVFSSLADAILVSGPLTGQPVDQSQLRAVREAVSSVPILANTGVNIDNVRDILSVADGVIIGTHFKRDGDTWNAVDGERVKRFMDVVAKLR